MEWKEERKQLFKKIDDLDNVIHVLEATANVHYSNMDKKLSEGWKILLRSRDKLKPFIEKEKQEIYDLVKKKDEVDRNEKRKL